MWRIYVHFAGAPFIQPHLSLSDRLALQDEPARAAVGAARPLRGAAALGAASE